MQKIAYTQMIADLFHYGHLKLLETAKKHTGYLIVGLLTDKAAIEQRGKLIEDYKEREAVLKQLKCVDEIIPQDSQEPNENLKEILESLHNAKIYLFHGSDWKKIPGEGFVKSTGGEVVTLPYYKRLGKDKLVVSYVKSNSLLSTKGETLYNLKKKLKKSKIENLLTFKSDAWLYDKQWIMDVINTELGFGKLVVRSSSASEDGYEESRAGHFKSVLNVSANSTQEITKAISLVIDSMDNNPENEVLIQKQTENIKMSGVVFTRKLETDAPYYVINYDDSGSTDSITSGKEDKKIEIIKNIKEHECTQEWWKLVEAIREIESLIPNLPLDIEFAITEKQEVVIFQVRPLAANKISTSLDSEIFYMVNLMGYLFEKNNAYSDMSFWNPAEIIGTIPNQLDYSLYKYIITNNHWDTALSTIGYRDVRPASLMKMFGGKPYIDLSLTFKALTPAKMPEALMSKLEKFYFDKLSKNPELHDKVEFDIIYNCFTFNTKEKLKELKESFTDNEIEIIKMSLIMLNTKIFKNFQHWLNDAEDCIVQMGKNRRSILRSVDHENRDHIITATKRLLDSCIEYGTIPFSRLARYAFIGNAILKSMVDQKIITKDFYDSFLKSISVVKMGGHLRPGTYDITSPRYDNSKIKIKNTKESKKDIEIPKTLERQIIDYDFPVKTKEIFSFAKKAIESREAMKFEFTKNLSYALELIAELGEKLGFTRQEMAQLDLDLILWAEGKDKVRIKDLWKLVIEEGKRKRTVCEKLSLPPTLFSKNDFKVVPTYISVPNYVTQKIVKGNISTDLKDIKNKIVFIENADPGFDWIFNEDIVGLVTCYGGVASHMAIRCAEKGIPAAIGCGTEIYNKLKKTKTVMLDCKNKKIEVDGK